MRSNKSPNLAKNGLTRAFTVVFFYFMRSDVPVPPACVAAELTLEWVLLGVGIHVVPQPLLVRILVAANPAPDKRSRRSRYCRSILIAVIVLFRLKNENILTLT